MTGREVADLHQAAEDTRRIVKSLARHARSATRLLTDLEERLERFSLEHPHTAEEAQDATSADRPRAIA